MYKANQSVWQDAGRAMIDFLLDTFLHIKIGTHVDAPFIFEFTLTNAGFMIILLCFALRWIWKGRVVDR